MVAETKRIEASFSRFRDDGIVSRIAAAAGRRAVHVDRETAALLNFAAASFQDSGGLFDITSGPLQRAWNFKTQDLPSDTEIQRAVSLVGWDRVEWHDPFLFLPDVGMSLDFGGIGKEYAVDRAADILRDSGIESALVNFAGDVRVVGPRPGTVPWRIGIVDPRELTASCAEAGLLRGALATSGDYERFKIVEGKRYCHVINPRTGMPVEGVRSVSVIAESCMIAGTLATIAMLHGAEKGAAFLTSADVPFLLIADDGRYRHRWPGSVQSTDLSHQPVQCDASSEIGVGRGER